MGTKQLNLANKELVWWPLNPRFQPGRVPSKCFFGGTLSGKEPYAWYLHGMMQFLSFLRGPRPLRIGTCDIEPHPQ